MYICNWSTLNKLIVIPKIDKIRFIAKQSNSLITGISESKLDSSIFDDKVDNVGYDIIRMDCCRRAGGSHVISKNGYLIIKSQVFVLTLKAFL